MLDIFVKHVCIFSVLLLNEKGVGRFLSHLPINPSEKTKKEPSLLKEIPFGNPKFLARTVVSSVTGLYFKTLPLFSPENIS